MLFLPARHRVALPAPLLLVGSLFFAFSLSAQPPQGVTPQGPLRIRFIGDVLMEAPWRRPPPPPAGLFAQVREALRSADVVICNLESPLTDSTATTPHKNRALVAAGRDFILKTASPEAAAALAEAGIRVASLANNHVMDYTERGLRDTLDRLRAAGILAVGAGENRQAAEQVRVVKVRGLRVGFLSFSDVVPRFADAGEERPGIASSKDVARMRGAIRLARPQADFLVVLFHWGRELARRPTPRQRVLAFAAATAGADVILGAHPHVLQGLGCEARVPVVYSAGNFVFPTSRPGSQNSAIFEIEVPDPAPRVVAAGPSPPRRITLRLLPSRMDESGRARLAEPALARWILSEARRLSSGLGVRFREDSASCAEPARGLRKKAPPLRGSARPAPGSR